MTTFVDTSALYAFLVADDANHAGARIAWARVAGADEQLLTHDYVVVETNAILQHRVGLEAVRALQDVVLPAFDVYWVQEDDVRTARTALLAAGRRDVSLVDHVSFLVMRQHAVRDALALTTASCSSGSGSSLRRP